MFEVAYIIINKKGEFQSKRKTFKTVEAMQKHIKKLDEQGVLYCVLGYSNPNE